MKRILLFLASISPGLFLLGYNIGTGSITTMAAAGASYGMQMMLPVLLSCVFTFYLVVLFGRFTIVSGQTVLQSFRQYFGTPISLIILISLLVSEWISCMGVMGIVVEVTNEWSKPLTSEGQGIPPVLITTLFGGLLYWLFLKGQHRFFERVLIVFVSLMGFSFILTMFMVIPSPQDLMRSMIPELPSDQNGLLLLAGMVGTTMGGILYVVRSILVQEKKWKLEDLKLDRRDALISASLMFVLSMAIMACAAATLHPQGLKVEKAIDMVVLLEPLAGRFAVTIFVVGIISAGLSSLFPIILLAPWLIADFTGKPRNLTSLSSRLLVLFGVLLGFVVPIFGGRPVFVMILSQAAASIATPLIILLILILINKPSLMGDHRASITQNAFMIFILFFTTAVALAGIIGISS